MGKITEKADKRTFEVDGVEYAVRRPKMEELVKANEQRRKVFNEELEAGSLLRDQLEAELRKRKMWSDDREAKYQQLRVDIIDMEYKLAKGGIKLSEAKSIALAMREKRADMIELLSSRTELDSNSCEGKADATRFNYLFANCLVYSETGEPYFPKGLDEYLVKQEDPVALYGANEFFYLISDTEEVDAKLPENQFLKKFKFVDDGLRLVDKEGRLTDTKGRHIDEVGNFIKWTSETEHVFVDSKGRELNEEGEFDIVAEPFLDDKGEPIDTDQFEEKVKKKKSPPKKRTSKKTKAEVEETAIAE
jgi:hypothetical protein